MRGAGQARLRVLPTATLDDPERTDLLLVPGGPGVAALMADDVVLQFLCRMAGSARYVTSVCTGSLVLGAAGPLLTGLSGDDALGACAMAAEARRDAGRGTGRRRSQPHHRRGRDLGIDSRCG